MRVCIVAGRWLVVAGCIRTAVGLRSRVYCCRVPGTRSNVQGTGAVHALLHVRPARPLVLLCVVMFLFTAIVSYVMSWGRWSSIGEGLLVF